MEAKLNTNIIIKMAYRIIEKNVWLKNLSNRNKKARIRTFLSKASPLKVFSSIMPSPSNNSAWIK